SWWSILPKSPLPALSHPAIVDGYSQSGASANTLATGDNAIIRIEIDGASAPGLAAGLDVGNAPLLFVGDFAQSNIQIYNASSGAFISNLSSGTLTSTGDVTLGPDGKIYVGSF